MSLKIGDAVADCTFLRPDGTPVRLSAFQARALVLVFLRHLA
ncbi:MAG TPA: hypothetical protein VG013_01780 [Gemmataceae bacterium]|jgi:peroxiredoxin|nr:hypothetical protein [Gemmataceae bacterium]